jgi:hypothetical protein
MRIYIESTMPSYVVARPSRDLLQAARQQLTVDWWELKRSEHELFISQVVLDEIAFGEAAMARRRLDLVQNLASLDFTADVRDFARLVLDSGLLHREADRDAAHIAFGTVHEVDVLLSWNCRRIANAAIQTRLRQLADSAGWTLPVICTPEELIGDSYE